MKYDHIIVGGGPGGMTLSTLLPGNNLLIERESQLGGCHRVRRVNGYFTEHGPRIYMTSYVNTINYLKSIGINYYDYFVPYNFQFLSIGQDQVIKTLSFSEITSFVKEYFFLFFNSNHGQDTTMLNWMTKENFSKDTMEYIDRICLLTDGADITRYTLWEFLNLVNQNVFYTTLQPKQATDKGFIKDWSDKIKCTILKDEEVIELLENGVVTNSGSYVGEKIILAMPPMHVKQLVDKSSYKPYDKEWIRFAELTEYHVYIPVTLHFDHKLELKKIWGLAKESKWGLVFINMSDYFVDDGDYVISVAITKADRIGYNGKTANQSNKEEIKEEVFNQMNKIFRFEKRPNKIIISPGVYRDGDKWTTKDSAFVHTTEGFGSIKGKGRYYAISPHSGKSDYAFTALESAVVAAIWLVNSLYPQKSIKLTKGWDLMTVLRLITIFFILLLTVYYFK